MFNFRLIRQVKETGVIKNTLHFNMTTLSSDLAFRFARLFVYRKNYKTLLLYLLHIINIFQSNTLNSTHLSMFYFSEYYKMVIGKQRFFFFFTVIMMPLLISTIFHIPSAKERYVQSNPRRGL